MKVRGRNGPMDPLVEEVVEEIFELLFASASWRVIAVVTVVMLCAGRYYHLL